MSLNVPSKFIISNVQMLIGQCVPTFRKDISKIRVKQLKLQPYIKMYYKKNYYVFVSDPERQCKPGDIVLVEKLAEKKSTLISHKITEVVYKYGDVIDPITNKKIVATQYREDMDRENELYGKLESTFNYETAPPRGWQEGKKDFTGKPTYRKFHVFPKEDPYAV